MIGYHIIFGLIVLLTLLPFSNNQHWVFRASDFAKVHVFGLTIINIIFGFLFDINDLIIEQLLLVCIFIYHAITIVKFTPLYPIPRKNKTQNSSKNITILSANVYQFNKDFTRFQNLILKHNPDIFITLESNSDWEIANRTLEGIYPNFHKVTLENTYGMHFYTKLGISEFKEHYFVADDIPCIEAHIKLNDGFRFIVFGVHPPPPSPTEEENSKERDGELLSLAKRITQVKLPVIVIGDLNNVAWARSSILFKKKGGLIDPRIGRGLISTFHAKYWLLKVPIDHVFHSSEVFVENIRALEDFGSDHLPIWAEFWIDHKNDIQEDELIETNHGEEQEINELIKEGIAQEGNREENAES